MSGGHVDQNSAPAVTEESFQGSLGSDFAAGIVVCLVALPLCLGIALASGAPLMSGLIAGVIGGLVISWAGGTALLVSGPAAGLAAIVLAGIAELGSFEALLAATVIAGALQFGLGLAQASRIAKLVPSSVVTGMLAAIGVLLVLQQSANLFGATLHGHAHGVELLTLPFQAVMGATTGPTIIGLATLAILVVWAQDFAKPLAAKVPGPLVAVTAGTLLAQLFAVVAPELAVKTVDLPDMGAGIGALIITPDWSALANSATWRVAVTLAIVASLETLLSMEATDRLDPLKRRSDGRRELLAQGVGNSLSGLIGGLPITGVIVRSTANIMSGGRTWRSGFIHGVLLAGAVLAIPGLLEHIPLAALAAVLVHTGWKLAHPTRFTEGYRLGYAYFLPLVGTVAAVVVTDLLIGVFFGLGVSLVIALASTARHGIHIETSDEKTHVRLSAPAVSFVHKPQLSDALENASHGSHLTIDGSMARAIDHDIRELLHSFAETARDRGIRYQLVGIPAPSAD